MALSSNILEQFGKATAKVESQVAQAVASKCPAGQHWDEFYQMCVKDAVGPELQASTFTSGAQAAVAPEIAPATAPAAPAPTLSSGAQAQVVPEALRMQPEPDRGFFGDVLNTAGNVASAVGNVPLGVIPGASGLSAALDIGGKDPTIGGAAQFALDESGNPVSRFIADEIRPRAADVGEFLGDEFAKSAPGVGLNAGLSAIGAAGGPKLDSGDIGRAVGEYGTPVSPLDLTLSLFVPATADWFDAYRILKGSSLFDDAGRFLPGVTRSQVDNVLRQFGKTVDDLPDLPIGAADALVKGTPVDQGTDAARLLSGPGAGREIPAPRPGIGGAGDEALYHGGADIPDNTLRRYQRGGQDAGGIFLTPNRAYAERYRPTSGGALYQAQIPEGARIFDASKPEDIAAFKAAIGDDYVWSQIAKGGDELSDWANLAQWADELEEAGFDGARFIERTGDPALGRVESVGLFGRELPATRVADEVPAGRATPPVGTAAEVPPSGAATSAAPAPLNNAAREAASGDFLSGIKASAPEVQPGATMQDVRRFARTGDIPKPSAAPADLSERLSAATVDTVARQFFTEGADPDSVIKMVKQLDPMERMRLSLQVGEQAGRDTMQEFGALLTKIEQGDAAAARQFAPSFYRDTAVVTNRAKDMAQRLTDLKATAKKIMSDEGGYLRTGGGPEPPRLYPDASLRGSTPSAAPFKLLDEAPRVTPPAATVGQAPVTQTDFSLVGIDDTQKAIMQQFGDNLLGQGISTDVNTIRRATATITGDLPDQYLTNVVNYERALKDVLVEDMLEKMPKLNLEGLTDAEKLDFQDFAITEVQSMIEKADRATRVWRESVLASKYTDPALLRTARETLTARDAQIAGQALSVYDQAAAVLKELKFGLDLGTTLQQDLKALRVGGSAAVSAQIGRLTDTIRAALGTDPAKLGVYTNPAISARAQRAADGLIEYGRDAARSVGLDPRTMRAPAETRTFWENARRAPGNAVRKLTNVQYAALQKVRVAVYEGMLYQAKLAGLDVSDSALRRQIADAANLAGSTTHVATQPGRALVEKRLLLSPQLTRSQFEELSQPLRSLQGAGSAIATANQIASTAATFAMGYVIADQLGVEGAAKDFWTKTANPLSSDFGKITLSARGADGKRLTWSFLPQFSLEHAILKSIRATQGETYGDSVLQSIGAAAGKYGFGRLNIPIGNAANIAGFGYGREGKFYWNGDMPLAEKAENIVPLPLTVTNAIQSAGGYGALRQDPLGTIKNMANAEAAIGALGGNIYGERDYSLLDRLSMERYEMEYFDIPPDKQAELNLDAIESGEVIDTKTRLGPYLYAANGALTYVQQKLTQDEELYAKQSEFLNRLGMQDFNLVAYDTMGAAHTAFVNYAIDAGAKLDQAEKAWGDYTGNVVGIDKVTRVMREKAIEADPGLVETWVEAYNNGELTRLFESGKWGSFPPSQIAGWAQELAAETRAKGTTSTSAPAVAPVMSFLEAGKATHPDERDAQQEYDTMMSAAQTGQGIDEAIAIAQSHLTAHQTALQPENLNNPERNPYVGEPEKNQEAVDGFTRVIQYLESLKGTGR